MSVWRKSHRADSASVVIADRHYNRQKVGTPQFVPPGRCLVFRSTDNLALWVTSWPLAQYTKHAWAGAWINTLFRREGGPQASELIARAVAHTRACWPAVPELGMVTFVDPRKVKPTRVRGRDIYGYCYKMAGFTHVGYTKVNGLWVWQMLQGEMPAPEPLPLELQAA